MCGHVECGHMAGCTFAQDMPTYMLGTHKHSALAEEASKEISNAQRARTTTPHKPEAAKAPSKAAHQSTKRFHRFARAHLGSGSGGSAAPVSAVAVAVAFQTARLLTYSHSAPYCPIVPHSTPPLRRQSAGL